MNILILVSGEMSFVLIDVAKIDYDYGAGRTVWEMCVDSL